MLVPRLSRASRAKRYKEKARKKTCLLQYPLDFCAPSYLRYLLEVLFGDVEWLASQVWDVFLNQLLRVDTLFVDSVFDCCPKGCYTRP